jgi:hypothetical protein
MIITLLGALAFAGQIVVQAEVPVEVTVDGRPAVQVFTAARVEVQATPGEHDLTLFVNGKGNKVRITVPETGAALVVVGRTGITTDSLVGGPVADVAAVELRVIGTTELRLVLDSKRYRLQAGGQEALELPRGSHQLELRSSDGTAVFAQGKLEILGTGPVLVHLSEGRAPEVVGNTGAWHPEAR